MNPDDDITKSPPHAIGMEKSVLSTILQDNAMIGVAISEGVDEDTFYIPSHGLLFRILEEEFLGQRPTELVSLIQKLIDDGLLDRIGGPSALVDIYNYAPSSAYFHNHLQGIKDKALLRDVIKVSREMVEHAYGNPGEVEELVLKFEINHKTIRKKFELGKSRRKSHVVNPDSVKDRVKQYMHGNRLLGGDGFFLPNFELGSRKREMTLWFGPSGHGKSAAVQNQIAMLAANGRKTFLASFEQPAEVTYAQIIVAMTANPEIIYSDEFDDAYEYVTSMVKMFDSMERTRPKDILHAFHRAYEEEGVDTWVIDNVMTMNVSRDDFGAQANAIDDIRLFVSEHDGHLHLVAHPRKPPEDTSKPPGIADIRGAAEWGDMPNNVIVVHRDILKGERLAEMNANNDNGKLDGEIAKFFFSTPCGKFIVRKQRSTGDWPVCDFWFDKETKRFMTRPGTPRPMFSQIPWKK